MPSVQSVHDYNHVALEDGGRLAHMAAELVDRLAILVAVGAVDSRSLRSNSYVRMQHFVRRSHVPFRRFLGGCVASNVVRLLFMVLIATLCRRAVSMLWHAFMFLGLSRHVGYIFSLLFPFRLVVSTFCKKFHYLHTILTFK
jgi:hypothetical protein